MNPERGAVLPAAIAVMLLVALMFGVALLHVETAVREDPVAALLAEEAVLGALRVAVHEMQSAGAGRCDDLPAPLGTAVLLNGHVVEVHCVDRGDRTYLWAAVDGRGRQAEVVHTAAGLRLRAWGPPEVAVAEP